MKRFEAVQLAVALLFSPLANWLLLSKHLVVVSDGDGERLVDAGADAARAGGAVRPGRVLLEAVVRRHPPPRAVEFAAQPQVLKGTKRYRVIHLVRQK